MTCCWIRGESRVRISQPMEHMVAMSRDSWCVRTSYGVLFESQLSTYSIVSGSPYVTPEVHQWIVGQELFTAYAVHILGSRRGKLLRSSVIKNFNEHHQDSSKSAVVISFRSKQEAFMFKLAHGESARYVL